MSDIEDTYFFNREKAKEVALQQNRIVIYHHHTFLQICYYDGPPFENAPQNLINVPLEKSVDFFVNTGLRLPTAITGGDLDYKKACLFRDIVNEAQKTREKMAEFYTKILLIQKPDFKNDLPWRIFFHTNRYTDVMKHCHLTLAKAFQKKGYAISVFIQEDDISGWDKYMLRKQAAEFKPHIYFNISGFAPEWLHPDTYFINWWQDITMELRSAKNIKWRDRDILFAQSFLADEMLKLKGAKNIHRQGIGVDTDIYRPMSNVKRERKVIFIGSSYITTYNSLPGCEGDKDILKILGELLESGQPITREIVEDLGNKYGLPYNVILERHAAYLLRERVIEWVCRQGDIKVEVYGRYWEQNPVVKPFLKGVLPFGEPVARAYNEAMYAISAVPANITIQRVVEMAACGCIPVVYDCRHIAEKPHWDNECLFFRSREELYACFDKAPVGNPIDIGKADSYDSFAEKILSIIREREGCTGL